VIVGFSFLHFPFFEIAIAHAAMRIGVTGIDLIRPFQQRQTRLQLFASILVMASVDSSPG
jgi:hypothetical protein